MWLFTRQGFYSVVCARQGDGGHGQPIDENRLMVRARVRDHLDALRKGFPDLLENAEIRAYPGSDYAFRIFVAKDIWVKVVAGLTQEIAYDNFKSEVAKADGDDDYEAALHDVWSVMYRLQKRA